MKNIQIIIDNLIIGLLKLRLRLNSYTLKVASTNDEVDVACDLRRRIFAEEKVSELNIDLRDEYDDRSVFFLCYHKNHLIGTYRQILNSGDLQVFKAFNVILPEGLSLSETSELSGLTIEKSHRLLSRLPVWGLHALSYQYAKRNNINWWVGIASPALIKTYKEAGGKWGFMDELPLTSEQLEARKRFPNYYKKHPNAKAYYIETNSYSPSIWLVNQIKKRVMIQ